MIRTASTKLRPQIWASATLYGIRGAPLADYFGGWNFGVAQPARIPLNANGIPTGTIEPVEGTPLDFREPHPIGKSIPDRGYDHNFVLRQHKVSVAVAEVSDPVSGRAIQVFTDQPGLQFYVPKFPGPPPNTNAPVGRGTAAFCLETQHFPDSPNQSTFPTTTLKPGSTFHSTTTYVFTFKRN
jgi:aldose 1-epimerase